MLFYLSIKEVTEEDTMDHQEEAMEEASNQLDTEIMASRVMVMGKEMKAIHAYKLVVQRVQPLYAAAAFVIC